ncbi:hypothetical protein [Rhodoblastus sp.]|uniref:hypothetical protein n=1 Tax=Rhodoblastus sp. TaxID=1962975 RepID=UPI003F94A16C
MKSNSGKSEAVESIAAVEANTIDQVRELLFGADKRATDTRFAQLDDKLEKLVADLRADLAAKFADLENRIETLARDVEHKRLTSIDDIGAAIANLGATVRNMGAPGKAR